MIYDPPVKGMFKYVGAKEIAYLLETTGRRALVGFAHVPNAPIGWSDRDPVEDLKYAHLFVKFWWLEDDQTFTSIDGEIKLKGGRRYPALPNDP